VAVVVVQTLMLQSGLGKDGGSGGGGAASNNTQVQAILTGTGTLGQGLEMVVKSFANNDVQIVQVVVAAVLVKLVRLQMPNNKWCWRKWRQRTR
jgi:hypothetical protein